MMINKNCGIYKITSPTGKVYIGQSVDLKRRFSEYKGVHACRFQPVIYRSLLKYGFEAHQFDIIEYCTEEELNCSERFWQDEFDVLGTSGLNLALQNCGEKRREFSEEFRKDKSIKMSGEGNHMYGRRGDDSVGWGRFGDLNANWDNKQVIDFVNWYIDLKELGENNKLENFTIIESFLDGDSVDVWKNIK